MARTKITVSYDEAQFLSRAEALAESLSLDIFTAENESGEYRLHVDDTGLSLRQGLVSKEKHGPIYCNFVTGSNAHRRKFGGGKGQDIAKAVGVTSKFRPSVMDLTAGLGGDSFVLASLGCLVTMLERNIVVHCLLKDGLNRACEAAGEDEDLQSILARLTLVDADSVGYLETIDSANYPDVCYLDPMFPERKKSAKVKKEMQAFHRSVGGDDDASELLAVALGKARYRVVVKRPAHADPLAGQLPTYNIKGKSTRFDIYALKKMPT